MAVGGSKAVGGRNPTMDIILPLAPTLGGASQEGACHPEPCGGGARHCAGHTPTLPYPYPTPTLTIIVGEVLAAVQAKRVGLRIRAWSPIMAHKGSDNREVNGLGSGSE